jgi:hypothetical protein
MLSPQAYVTGICCRMVEATRVPFRQASAGAWRPKVAECHQNVTAWVERNPKHAAVRGWVTWYPVLNGVRLTHHSVVQAPDGSLFDITPLRDESYRPGMRFIRHVGDEQTFWQMKAAMNAFDCYDCGAA